MSTIILVLTLNYLMLGHNVFKKWTLEEAVLRFLPIWCHLPSLPPWASLPKPQFPNQ